MKPWKPRVCLVLVVGLAACTPEDAPSAVFWKDTLALTADPVGEPPSQAWLVTDEAPIVGGSVAAPNGGVAAVFDDGMRASVYTRVYDGNGALRVTSPKHRFELPRAGLVAMGRGGTFFAVYEGVLTADTPMRAALWETVTATGTALRTSPTREAQGWTHAAMMADNADVMLVAAGDGTEPVRVCRVGIADHREAWCDESSFAYRAVEEDDDIAFNHEYTPVVAFLEPAPDGGYFLGGPLEGRRDVACGGERVCEETSTGAWVGRYSSYGEELWTSRFASFPWVLDEDPVGIVPLEDGGVLVGGTWTPKLEDGLLAQRAFVARLDADGAVRFARSFEGTAVDAFVHFTSDGRGGAMATVLSASFETILLLDVDAEGDVVWSRRFEELPLAWSFDESTRRLALEPGSYRAHADGRGGFTLLSMPGEQPDLGDLPTTFVMKLTP